MTQASPQLIAIDMDGTLLGTDGRVSPRNAAALRLAHRAGSEVVIATGRRHGYAMGPLRHLNLHRHNALISSNGTVIRSVAAEPLHTEHMPLETARWLCDHTGDFRSTLVVTFDKTDQHGVELPGALVAEHGHTLHTTVNKWMEANAPFFFHVDRIEDALTGEPPIQMMLCGGVDRMRAAEALLAAHPRVAAPGQPTTAATEITLHRTEYADRDLSIIDILPVGISKASALRRLSAIRGIPVADMMAIGDNFNDLAMLELVGHPVVMSNAAPDLLQLAHHRGWTITRDNDADGVAVAIEKALGMPEPAIA